MRIIKEKFEDKARLVGDISDFIDALEHPLENEDDKYATLCHSRNLDVVNPTKLLPCRFLWVYKILGYKLTLLYCLWHLLKCDYIFMLDGWEESKGARIEKRVAWEFGIKRINYDEKRFYTNIL